MHTLSGGTGKQALRPPQDIAGINNGRQIDVSIIEHNGCV